MANVYGPHGRGTVVKLKDGRKAIPFSVAFKDPDDDTKKHRFLQAIVTQAVIVQQGNYQFSHSINDTIYVYVFGDRIGELRVSGTAFPQVCEAGGGAGAPSSVSSGTGYKEVLDFYDTNRISKRGKPVEIAFGATAFEGFLVNMQIQVADAEHLLGQWTYQFSTFPQPQQRTP